MPESYVMQADLTWTGTAFESDLQVAVSGNGTIEATGRLGRPVDMWLRHQALLPGFISAHSHAFQRGLRGRGERFPADAGSFWTWRTGMYDLVDRLDDETLYGLCRQTFREMLQSGITTVGEFHYLHHASGTDWAFDRVVLRAARDAGIRIVLLNTYYRTGGVRRPLEGAQRRFDGVSPVAYWEQMDALTGALAPASQHLGVAIHSVRAASLEDIAAVHEEARRRQLVVHLHVEEQRAEIADCEAAFGRPPLALLTELMGDMRDVTAVHCTHTADEDMAEFLARGGAACICPLTEANLGDGIPLLARAFAADHRLSIGTDSNARIAMPEEMRWLEYAQRLREERRGVLRPADGHVARALLDIATRGGARALGIDAGRIAPGALADFTTLDLDAPELDGYDADTLADALIFGAGTRAISRSCVGGRWLEPS